MTHSLKQFLDFITYNGLFHYVTIPISLAAAINDDKDSKELCHVEPINELVSVVWYPQKAWIDECKRREEVNETRDTWKQNIKPPEKDLLTQIQEASKSGNKEELERLTKELLSKL